MVGRWKLGQPGAPGSFTLPEFGRRFQGIRACISATTRFMAVVPPQGPLRPVDALNQTRRDRRRQDVRDDFNRRLGPFPAKNPGFQPVTLCSGLKP